MVAAGAAVSLIKSLPAFAEFEIPQVDAQRGGLEVEYRGASHWGLPDAIGGDDGLDALRQSHEVEFQYGVTDWWMLRVTPNVEQPDGESLELASVGVESQFVLVPRRGGTFGLAFMAGYGAYSFFVVDDTPDEFEFGPVIEVAPGPWLLTLNPRLVDQVGEFADQEWLGFEYAAQLKYRVAKRWALAVLMFGEIEDLANAGPFNAQTHVLGPSLYLSSAPEQDGGEQDASRKEGREWSLGIGTLFGLTDASADAALRVTFAVEY